MTLEFTEIFYAIKIEEGKVKLAELKKASDSAFDALKKGVETAWDSLKTAFNTAAKSFKA